MNPLDLVKLSSLMERTSGRPEIVVGLIDGPVAMDHPDLATKNVRALRGKSGGNCTLSNSTACMHGTFVAGVLFGKRGTVVPAICPNCTLLVRSIFWETTTPNGQMPSATSQELATAIIDCIEVGGRVLNLSTALVQLSSKGEHELEHALNYAARRRVITVAAAGNQGTVGSSAITRHPGVIPVVACDLQGKPIGYSNLGSSIGRRGLRAPGEGIISLGTDGKPHTFGGTSAAAPFVTGTVALLWSEFPAATAAQVRFAVTNAYARRGTTIVPPLLDAEASYRFLIKTYPI